MRLRTGSALLGLALAVSMTAVALAQVDDTAVPGDGSASADFAITAPATDQPTAAALFVQVLEPAELDVEVPDDATVLTVRGVTVPGAVVSVDGNLVDVDDRGNFCGVAQVDEGANEIDVVASDSEGNQVSTTLFVVRGE
jgi:Glucodextranase, domain B